MSLAGCKPGIRNKIVIIKFKFTGWRTLHTLLTESLTLPEVQNLLLSFVKISLNSDPNTGVNFPHSIYYDAP